MTRIVNFITVWSMASLLVGCVPVQPQPKVPVTPTIGDPIHMADYGYPPSNYKNAIKSYFANKIDRAELASYSFSSPQRAYKRSGLAYGGDITWKGWLVDVAVATPSRTGRMMAPKPYMVLFNDSVIVEDILGSEHQLVTRVQK